MSLEILTEAEIKAQILYKYPRLCLDFDVWNLPKKKTTSRFNTWTDVKFDKINIPSMSSVSGKQGIYMFIVKPPSPAHINHAFILYVGETDDLARRFSSYFNYRTTDEPSDQLKRIMTIVWENYLYFSYIETTYATKKDREEEEYDLIDTICPPHNDKFRSKILKAKRKQIKHLISI